MLEILAHVGKVNKETINLFYSCPPLSYKKKYQTPGFVLQYLFDELAKEPEKWGTKTFRTLTYLLSVQDITTFSVKDCAVILHRFVVALKMLSREDRIPYIIINDLLSQLHKHIKTAEAYQLSLAIRAVGKLSESGFIPDKYIINALFARLSAQHASSTSQDLSMALWAVGKLIERGFTSIDKRVINSLLVALSSHGDSASPQSLANGLWLLGKLVEFRFTDIDKAIIDALLSAVIKRDIRDPQALAITVWACGIINTQTPISVPDKLIRNALEGISPLAKREHKNQIITGIFLLGLNERFNISALIEECRPAPSLKNEHIPASLRKEGMRVEKEACIWGYYVDAIITYNDGTRLIFEVDGIYHKAYKQHTIDQFRDEILLQKGYNIYRIDLISRTTRYLTTSKLMDSKRKDTAAAGAGGGDATACVSFGAAGGGGGGAAGGAGASSNDTASFFDSSLMTLDTAIEGAFDGKGAGATISTARRSKTSTDSILSDDDVGVDHSIDLSVGSAPSLSTLPIVTDTFFRHPGTPTSSMCSTDHVGMGLDSEPDTHTLASSHRVILSAAHQIVDVGATDVPRPTVAWPQSTGEEVQHVLSPHSSTALIEPAKDEGDIAGSEGGLVYSLPERVVPISASATYKRPTDVSVGTGTNDRSAPNLTYEGDSGFSSLPSTAVPAPSPMAVPPPGMYPFVPSPMAVPPSSMYPFVPSPMAVPPPGMYPFVPSPMAVPFPAMYPFVPSPMAVPFPAMYPFVPSPMAVPFPAMYPFVPSPMAVPFPAMFLVPSPMAVPPSIPAPPGVEVGHSSVSTPGTFFSHRAVVSGNEVSSGPFLGVRASSTS